MGLPLLLCMGVKLGLTQWGRRTAYGYLRSSFGIQRREITREWKNLRIEDFIYSHFLEIPIQNIRWTMLVERIGEKQYVYRLYILARPTRCNFTQWYLLLWMLYMFQAVPPPIIRSSKLYTQHEVFVELFLLLAAIVSWNSLTIAVRSRKRSTNTWWCVYSFELLMMGGGTAWNM